MATTQGKLNRENTMTAQYRIVFTGGGTAGHVTPNLALIEKFQEANWNVSYIGSKDGIEKTLVLQKDIPYYGIHCGKLRRYFSWRNFLMPFEVLLGILESLYLCFFKLRPYVIFSKGGFVAVPVVVTGWLLGIPVVVHESDFTPGLANKLSFPFATRICTSFRETANYIKDKSKVIFTGTPIRPGLLNGNAERGRAYCEFTSDKKIVLILGGSLGAQNINIIVREALPELLQQFQIIHVCGKDKLDSNFDNIPGYKQFEYLHDELFDLMAAADIVVSRAGANSVYELLALKKPNILIPLDKGASRGDQIDNAAWMEKQGISKVIPNTLLNKQNLLETIQVVSNQQEIMIAAAKQQVMPNSIEEIYRLVAHLF